MTRRPMTRRPMTRRALAALTTAAILTTSIAATPIAAPLPDRPTFEHECQHPDGDENGNPCIWTAPNGKQYFQDSRNYRHGPQQGSF